MPKGDKQSRFCAISPTIEGGHVFLPERAPWLDEYLHEICGFPATKHDDQIDSTSQALLWIQIEGSPGGLHDYYRELNDERRAFLEDRIVHLRAPHGINRVGLRDGTEISVGVDGSLWVAMIDAGSLRLAGFVDIGP